MTNSRCKRWERIRTIEDALALIYAIDFQRTVIREQSWNEGDWQAVYQAATEQAEPLKDLQRLLSDRWYEMMNGVES